MNNDIKRPQGMSQLDYLWTHFGGYEIKDSSDSILLTEEAISNLIKESSNRAITKLTYSDNERTLTEKEVMDNFENIINKVTNNLNVKLRG